nr:unnamed protein product [Digitaria exilis]
MAGINNSASGAKPSPSLPEVSYVTSAPFSAGGCDWFISFYPDGDYTMFRTGHLTSFTSVYLNFVGGPPTGTRVMFVFSLLDDKGCQVSTKRGKRRKKAKEPNMPRERHMTTFDYPGQSWGSSMFFEKSVLADVLESCNGCFTIRCDMCIVRLKIEDNPIQIPDSVLHQDLSRMLKDKEGTDVTFSVGDRFFHAHRYILAARSMVFKAQLFGAMKEAEDAQCIKVEDMEPQAFEGLLHYIYTDALPDDHNTADRITATQHLLVAADRYGLDRLRAMCEARLSGWIDVQSVATILALAEQHQCVELRNHCLRFLGWPDILRAVMKTDGFKHLVASYPSVVSDVLETVVSARIAQ